MVNPLTDIYGDMGNGKTIFMTYIAWKNPDIPVYADYKLNLPNFKPLEIDELLSLPDEKALILFDEIDEYLNNRRSMSNLSLFLNTVMKQTRKRKLEVLGSTQLLDTIDSRFTRQTKLSVIALGELKEGKMFYDLIYKSMFGNNIVSLVVNKSDFEKLYDKYDTSEPIMPEHIKDLGVEIKNRKKFNSMINDLTDEIIKRREEFCLGKKITEKRLRDVLLQMDKPEDLAFYVASRLEQKLNSSVDNA